MLMGKIQASSLPLNIIIFKRYITVFQNFGVTMAVYIHFEWQQ